MLKNTLIKRTFLACLILTLSISPAFGAEEDGWIQLFNGKDLGGWIPKITGYPAGENFGDTFRVVDGYLTVSYDQYEDFGTPEKFGHLFYKTPYSSYKFRVEYRFIGEQVKNGPGWAFMNSGIMLHGQAPETMTIDQDFPSSIEVQLLGGNGTDERTNCNVCTPGTHIVLNDKLERRHCMNSKSKTYHGDQWVTAEVEVHSDKSIKHILDGEVVLEYTQPQLDPKDKNTRKVYEKDSEVLLTGGYISLQSESHPIQFRKVEILPLKD